MSPQVVLPVPTRYDVLETPLHRLGGESIAVLNNGWACMDELSLLIEDELVAAGASRVLHFHTPHGQPSPDEFLDEIAASVAGAITGLGN
jgi:hypothetical protein